MKPPRLMVMFLGYIDDSGTTGCNKKDPQSRFQVVGGPIIDGEDYNLMETFLAIEARELIREQVSEENFEKFEFHAVDLFHVRQPWDVLGLEKCHQLMKAGLERASKRPVIFGAVDKHKLRYKAYGSANSYDFAFRLYLRSLKQWLEKYESADGLKFIVLVADETSKDVKHLVHETFRAEKETLLTRPLGVSDICIIDDIYYGDSLTSLGIQIADLCAFTYARHLAGYDDIEEFYNIIKGQIIAQPIEPRE